MPTIGRYPERYSCGIAPTAFGGVPEEYRRDIAGMRDNPRTISTPTARMPAFGGCRSF
ncbi:MAG: hypothetical protein K2O69_04670 [Odoribacter sp.]|nr:hypothetical protein [Odoribacter sp.]